MSAKRHSDPKNESPKRRRCSSISHTRKMTHGSVGMSERTSVAIAAPSSPLPLRKLSELLGVRIRGILGRGQYEVYEGIVCACGKAVAVKIFVLNEPSAKHAKHARAEERLARWGAMRGIGPRIHMFKEFDLVTSDALHKKKTIAALVMDRMSCTLQGLPLSGHMATLLQSWRAIFDLIATRNFACDESKDAWYCCNDLKPSNVLIGLDSKGMPQHVLLGDWDERHWHVLSVPESSARFLNKLTLILNSLLLNSKEEGTKGARIACLWPEDEEIIAMSIVNLAAAKDSTLQKFLTKYDLFFNGGPYHYAGSKGSTRKARARRFSKALGQVQIRLSTVEDAGRMRQRLQEHLS